MPTKHAPYVHIIMNIIYFFLSHFKNDSCSHKNVHAFIFVLLNKNAKWFLSLGGESDENQPSFSPCE